MEIRVHARRKRTSTRSVPKSDAWLHMDALPDALTHIEMSGKSRRIENCFRRGIFREYRGNRRKQVRVIHRMAIQTRTQDFPHVLRYGDLDMSQKGNGKLKVTSQYDVVHPDGMIPVVPSGRHPPMV